MRRRGFLGALLGAAVLDPERLLWVPGAKVISIPPRRVLHYTMLISIDFSLLPPGAPAYRCDPLQACWVAISSSLKACYEP